MLRVALICDLLEERWASMDLVGDMLFEQLSEHHKEDIEVDRIRPALRARLSALPGTGGSQFAWNTDRLLNRMVDYPRLLRRRAAAYDLYHIVDHSYSQLAHGIPAERTVITCHDLDTFRCLTQPDREPRPRWFRAMSSRILNGLRRAAHVIFDSESVKRAALGFGIVRADRASVIHLGVHPSCRSSADPAADAEAARLLRIPPDVPMLLNVGSTIPRKRIDLLLRIFAAVRTKLPSVRLVRVGGGFTAAQAQLAEQLNVKDAILELPFLDRATLAAIYRRSALLLQTSEAEGFGLPLVEAMACGCPVIASDIPILREVGGEAAHFCAAGDIEQWTDVVLSRLEERSGKPGAWERWHSDSIRNAERFSWRQTAAQVAGVYQQVLGS